MPFFRLAGGLSPGRPRFRHGWFKMVPLGTLCLLPLEGTGCDSLQREESLLCPLSTLHPFSPIKAVSENAISTNVPWL